MILTGKKLDEMITCLKHIHTKSKVTLISNNVYYYNGQYFYYNKSKNKIEINETYRSDSKYIFTNDYPVIISQISIKLDGSNEVQVVKNQMKNVDYIPTLPDVLLNEMQWDKMTTDSKDYMFEIKVPKLCDDLKLEQVGENVKIIHNGESVRTILFSKLYDDRILCNSWSYAEKVIAEAIKKYDDMAITKSLVERRELLSYIGDIRDNIDHRFEKLDCQKMNKAMVNIILGIQSGRYDK